jgi:hypothetical protein
MPTAPDITAPLPPTGFGIRAYAFATLNILNVRLQSSTSLNILNVRASA